MEEQFLGHQLHSFVCFFFPGEMCVVLLISPRPCETVLVLELSPNAFSIT